MPTMEEVFGKNPILKQPEQQKPGRSMEDVFGQAPQRQKYTKPYVEPEKNPSFLGTVARGIAQPFARFGTSAVNLGESVIDLARGDVQGASEALKKTRDIPLYGTAKPVITGSETKSEYAKKIAGTSLDIASNIVGFGAGKKIFAQGAKEGAKALFKQGVKTGVKEGATFGAMEATGKALQDDKSAGEVIAEGTFGGLFGGTFGGILGGSSAGIKGLLAPKAMQGFSKVKDALIKTPKKKIESAREIYSKIFDTNQTTRKQMQSFQERFGEELPDTLLEYGVKIDTKGESFFTKEAANELRDNAIPAYTRQVDSIIGEFKDYKAFDLDAIEEKAIKDIKGMRRTAGDTKTALENNVRKLINEERTRLPEKVFDAVTAQDMKQGLYGIGYDTGNATKKDAARLVSKILKEEIEEKTGNKIIRDLNNEIAKVIQASDFLDNLSGKTVRGGRLGAGYARLLGVIATSKLGPLSSIIGGEIGNKIGAFMRDVSRLSEKSVKAYQKQGVLPKGIKTIEEAQDFLFDMFKKKFLTDTKKIPQRAGTMLKEEIKTGIENLPKALPEARSLRDVIRLPEAGAEQKQLRDVLGKPAKKIGKKTEISMQNLSKS